MNLDDSLRQRFAELTAERTKIMKVLGPMQNGLEALVKDDHDSKALRAKIIETRGPLFEIDNERAAVARHLRSRNLTVA